MALETETADLTVAVQDYLKAIYALESSGRPVTTSALAARMGVRAPSATAMTKRLAELGLVERRPYKGVALTENGRWLVTVDAGSNEVTVFQVNGDGSVDLVQSDRPRLRSDDLPFPLRQ